MNIEILKRIGFMLVLIIVQVTLLSRIHLFDCATPLLFIYFIVLTPLMSPHWVNLPLAFILGFSIDAFSNTPGLAATALPLMAFIQPYALTALADCEKGDNFYPSLQSMGWLKFSSYVFFLVAVFCLIFFLLEVFSFFNWQQWLMSTLGSMLITLIFIYVLELARR